MRTLNYLLSVLFIGITMIGCASSTGGGGDVPDWFLTPPDDPNFWYAPNSQVSADMQLALDKAVQGGRTEIGRKAEVLIQGLQKRFTEETGTVGNSQLLDMFTQASKTVVNTSLSGSRIAKQKIMKEGNGWRGYALVEYAVGAAREAMMQQIKNNEQLYTRFRQTQTFKELDEEVKKFDEFKKNQKQQ
ncbi:MAG: hypothetical protein V1799_19055 [bacterium]